MDGNQYIARLGFITNVQSNCEWYDVIEWFTTKIITIVAYLQTTFLKYFAVKKSKGNMISS